MSALKGVIRQVSTSSGLFKDATFVAIADGATKGASGILALIIARYVGPSLFGEYATATAVSGLFLIATGIGFEQEFTRRGGKSATQIRSAFQLNIVALLLASVVGTVGLGIYLGISPYSVHLVTLTLVVWVAQVLARLQFSYRYLSILIDRTATAAIVQVVAMVILVAGTLICLATERSILEIVVVQLMVGAGSLLVWRRLMPDYGRPLRIQSWRELYEFSKQAIPFGMSNVIWIAYFNIDVFMLSLMAPAHDVGVYGGIFRIVSIVYIAGFAISSAFIPKLFAAHGVDMAGFRRLSRLLVVLLVSAGGVLCGSLVIFGPEVLRYTIGPEFASVAALNVLCAAAFLRFANFGLSDVLTTSNRQPVRVTMETIMLVMNIVANIILIPRHGFIGAAMATTLSELVLLVGLLSYLVILQRTRPVEN